MTRLALHASPFSQQLLPGAFFEGRNVSQRLNLILHLLRASDKVALIDAESGMGKTALLSALMSQPAEDLRLCFISASDTISLSHINQACIKAFGAPDDPEHQGDNQQLLRQRLQQLQQLQIYPVLIVDDADKLPTAVKQQLSVWLHWQRQGRYLLNAVLSCTDQQATSSLQNDRFQLLSLVPIPEDETTAYCLQRLVAAGFLGEIPFTAEQLKRFHRQSKGVPAELNHQAHQALLGVNRRWQLPQWRVFKKLSGFKWSRWMSWLPLLVLLIAALAFQETINQWLGQTDTAESEVTQTIEAPAELATVIVEDEPITSAAQAERNELVSLLEELAQQDSAIQSTPNVASDIEPADIADNSQAIAFEPVMLIEPVPEENTIAEQGDSETHNREFTPDPEKTQAEASPATEPPQANINDAAWLLSQNSRDYSFQMMGSWQRQELVRFITKYQLEDPVAIFASMREGKIWYALMYGVYNSRQAAINASNQWPAPLSGLPNWLRRLDGVQQQITEKAPDA